jgi:UDP-N-acetylmuramate--alanine ligase
MILPKQIKSLHFIGIGGVGMSALARMALHHGYSVSGSDSSPDNILIQQLIGEGAKFFRGHSAANIKDADVVIYSTAIREDNPELVAAEQKGIPVWHRSELLAASLNKSQSIGISGTHGKTTVSAMTSLMMEAADMDPTALVGAMVPKFESNLRLGKSPWVVAECDESDQSFLRYNVQHAIITNIEADHLENYGSYEAIQDAFKQFLKQVRPDGMIVLSADDEGIREMLPTLDVPYVTYGLFPRIADVRARNIKETTMGSSFDVEWRGHALGSINLVIPGIHNISNALGVIALGRSLGIPFETIAATLERYTGVHRRFEIKGTRSGVTVVDDYAHHPTEVIATLSAAVNKKSQGRVISVFQPHRFSRTQAMSQEFGRAFGQSDHVVVTDVYAAGEDPIDGVSGRTIFESIQRSGHPNVSFIPTNFEVEQHLLNTVQEGDVVLTMGAGDIWRVGEQLLDSLPS